MNRRRWLREFLLSCLILLIIFYIVSRLDLSEKLYAFSRAYEVVDLDDMLFSLGLFLPIYIVIFAVRRFGELAILVRESSTDGLTGLINHRRVQVLLAQEVSRAHRFQRPLSVVLLDIDNFKDVNDTHGHPVGDAVLRRVASLLSSVVREVDYLARTGGEEFLLIATETDGALAREVAERMRLILSNADFGIGRPVTASFGVSQLRSDEAVAVLLQRADERLYWSKRDGRNRVCGIETDRGSKSA